MPWLTSMDYHSDVKLLRNGRVDDPALRFSPAAASACWP